MQAAPVSLHLASTHRALPGEAEAARYVLLRRLAPMLRHHLVVNLQPIGMACELVGRRLRAPQADQQQLHASATRINDTTREALDACLDVMAWLAPDGDASVPLHQGVRDSLQLLGSSLSFRGYVLRNQVAGLSGRVCCAALRHLLAAALVHVTDEQPAPAALVVVAQARPEGACVDVTARVGTGEAGLPDELPCYRRFGCDDLLALAQAEAVAIECGPGAAVRFVLPWIYAAMPTVPVAH